MDQSLSLLNKWVDLHFSTSSDHKPTNLVYKGQIIQVDQDSIVVSCSAQEVFLDQSQQTAMVKVLQNFREVSEFTAVVLRHQRDLETNQELFMLQNRGGAKLNETRTGNRVSLKTPGQVSINSIKGMVVSADVRKKKMSVVIRDISGTGAQILTNDPLPEHAIVTLRFSVGHTNFEENAEIIWSRVVSKYYLYGLHFSSPDLFMQQFVNSRR